MSKISNVILMLEYLNTKRKYSIQELSDLLEVSPRMIRIYKDELEKAGIFIDTLKGIYGGYILNQSINFPALLFDNNDLDTIKQCILNSDDNTLREKLSSIEKKISTNLLKELKSNNNYISNNNEQNIYNKLNQAIKCHYKVKIKYYNLQHGESTRTVYPLGLYLFQNEWWCSSYWEEKDDMRQFHIKRITDCELLPQKFDPKEINIKF